MITNTFGPVVVVVALTFYVHLVSSANFKMKPRINF